MFTGEPMQRSTVTRQTLVSLFEMLDDKRTGMVSAANVARFLRGGDARAV
jgi:Ca2+-binding EF-hand superfamily protein